MSWMNNQHFLNILQEVRGKDLPTWDDQTRGILLALIEGKQMIWNTKNRLVKEEVLEYFQQISTTLSYKDDKFNVWAIIEKWCWMVELFYRTTTMKPPQDWRYKRTLDFFKPFAQPTYPFLGCLSIERLVKLTETYESDQKLAKILKNGKFEPADLEHGAGLFKNEMAFYALEKEFLDKLQPDTTLRSVLMAQPKRRGRPPKIPKIEPITNEIEVNNPSENQSANSEEINEDKKCFDNFGFNQEMYDFLIESVREKAELWHVSHPERENNSHHLEVYEEIAKKMVNEFKNKIDLIRLTKIDKDLIKNAWESIKEKFYEEEKKEKPSKWLYFSKLHFLSARVMPAFLFDSVYLNNGNDSAVASTSKSGTAAVGSPSGSRNSVEVKCETEVKVEEAMTSSSSSSSLDVPSKLQSALDNLFKQQQAQNLTFATSEDIDINNSMLLSEIQRILAGGGSDVVRPQPLHQKRKNEELNGASGNSKKVRSNSPTVSSPTSSTTTMVVVNDARKNVPTTISTWVPPKEEITTAATSGAATSAVANGGGKKEENVSTPKKAINNGSSATAVIKTNCGSMIEKQLRKMQQTIAATIGGPSASNSPTVSCQQSRATNGSLLSLTPMTSLSMQNPALTQALFKPQIEKPSIMMNNGLNGTTHDVTTTTTTHLINGNGRLKNEDDKWSLLGKLISVASREIESRDPIIACHLFKELQELVLKYQLSSLTAMSNINRDDK